MKDTLKVSEIFYSLQGESSTVGWPTVFVRLTGCPLRCVYCDTAYAFHGGKRYVVGDVLAEVGKYGVRHVTVTGGEPLAQPGCLQLLGDLCDANYRVSLETSGAMDISSVDRRVLVVMDVKTPASGEEAANLWDNLAHLKSSDEIKFVIADRADYEWSVECCRLRGLTDICAVLFSPSYQLLAPGELADWILADRLAVRMQVQLHKVLWGDAPGR